MRHGNRSRNQQEMRFRNALIFDGEDALKRSQFRNEKGFTLVELMVALVIMTILTAIVSEITIVTVRTMVESTDLGIATTNAKSVLRQMTDDIRSAGVPMNGAPYAISTSSNSKQICITAYGVNLDALVNGTDIDTDIICYKHIPPNGDDPSKPSYQPGYIMMAHGSGGGDPSWGVLGQRVTSHRTDIVDMTFEYCRPKAGNPGSYECDSTGNSGATSLTTNDKCVFQIRISMSVARSPNTVKTGPPPTTQLKATVAPRNIIFTAIHQDANSDDLIDCCDHTVTGKSDVTWCPPAQKGQ